MKMNLSLILVANLLLAVPALAANEYAKEVPFQIKGSMTHYYGFDKSAEAVMWENALKVCHDLNPGENNSLILNRLSEVVITRENFTSHAEATFVCLPVGSAG